MQAAGLCLSYLNLEHDYLSKYKRTVYFRNKTFCFFQCDFEMLHLRADTAGILHPDPNFNFTVTTDINITSEVIKMLMMVMMMMMMLIMMMRMMMIFTRSDPQ